VKRIGNNAWRKSRRCEQKRRSFDCASCDETARGSAQDDNFSNAPDDSLALWVAIDISNRPLNGDENDDADKDKEDE